MKLSKIFLISLSFLIALFSLTACVYPLNSTDINSDNNTGSSQDAENFDADRPTVNDGSETNGDTDVLVLSLVNGLNIRLGAGTNYPSLGTLDKGDMVSYIATQDGWYKTVYKQQTAYISANENYTSLFYMKKSSDKTESVISVAKTLLGYPYVWGAQRYHWGNGVLNTDFVQGEFDCSALTLYAYYIGADVTLKLTTREQVTQGEYVPKDEIKRGDLLFFTNASRFNLSGVERVGHVAIYLGDNYILYTASDHAVIEQISPTRRSYFLEARRLI